MVRRSMSRSENMARVRGRDTGPEIYVRKLLWHRGFRYRVNYGGLPGRPDIFVGKHGAAVFVNGCFWHMHPGCKLATIPKTNRDFWRDKLEGNFARDQRVYGDLRSMGLKVIVIWGCEIKRMQGDAGFEAVKMDEISALISG